MDILNKIKKDSIEYLKIAVNIPSILISAIVSVLLVLPINDFKVSSLFAAINCSRFLFTFLGNFFFTMILLSIPVYVIRRLDKFKTEVNDNLKSFEENFEKRIEQISTLVAIHTEDNTFEDKIKYLDNKDLVSSQRWIYAKYVSKLLSKSFGSFSINNIAPFEYSIFSSGLIKETKSSIKLLSSMRLSEWLNSLSKTDYTSIQKKEDFFNNIGETNDFPVDKDNHSIVLKNCDYIKNRERRVYITPYDLKYLFISERILDTYNHFNNGSGLVTKFFNGNINNQWNFNEIDYALYDEKILLKWHRKDKKLDLISDNNEISDFIEFFNNEISPIEYIKLKNIVQKTKCQYLHTINDSKILPHKLSYLYSGGRKWAKYVELSDIKYCDLATQALQKGLQVCFPHIKQNNNGKGSFEIIDIGSGTGNRISTICDCLGTNKIKKYTLIDISSTLLDQAESVLINRLPSDKIQTIALDCCDAVDIVEIKKIIKNKHVLIPTNSTLFQEKGFDIRDLIDALDIFITLDIFNKNDSYKDHIQAVPLLLQPLKIFEIPIDEKIIFSFEDALFCNEYSDNNFKIIFNLKMYIGILKNEITEYNFIEYNTNKNYTWDHYCHSITGFLNKYNNNSILLSPKDASEDYINKKKKLFEQKELVILSSLKFKDDNSENVKMSALSKAKDYFKNKGFKVQEKDIDGNFISLLLKKENS